MERLNVTGVRVIHARASANAPANRYRPVAEGARNDVRNGTALSGAVHWMFNRGLISVDDDHSILIAKHRLPEKRYN